MVIRYKREISKEKSEFLLIAAQNNAITINNVKVEIDNTPQIKKIMLC